MAILLHCAACGRQFRIKDQFRGTRLRCPNCKKELLVRGPHVHGYDVFVSHSSKDKQVADAVCAAMESKGVRCWIAPRDIPPGASWASAIIEGLEDSRVVVLVFSGHANESQQVAREIAQAVGRNVPIVPFRIDATPLRKDFSYFLSTCHWLDAAGAALDQHLSQLTSTVRGMLLERAETEPQGDASEAAVATPVPKAGSAVVGGESPLAVSVPISDVPAPRRRARRRPFAALAVVFVLTGGTGAVLYGTHAVPLPAFKRSWFGLAPAPIPTPTSGPASAPALAQRTPGKQLLATVPATAAAPASYRHVDLLRAFDPTHSAVSGDWTMDGGRLVCTSAVASARVEFPYAPPAEYDYAVTFTRDGGNSDVKLICAAGGRQFAWIIGGANNTVCGFSRVDRKLADFNLTGRRARRWITNGRPYTTLVKVRKSAVEGYLDGQLVCRLETDYGNMDLQPNSTLHAGNTLGLVSDRSTSTIEAVEVTEITGVGKRLP